MTCERFEELLIDLIEDEVTPSERETVKAHLESCPYCSKNLEEYQEIRRIFSEEPLPQPSAQVLNRLSGIAREAIERDKTPFWKKWFYSPILVPLLSTGLALLVWVSYGEKDLKEYLSGTAMYSSRDVMAKKMPVEQEPNLPDVGEKIARKMESPPTAPLPESSSVSALTSKGMSSAQEEAMRSSLHSEEMSAGKDAKETDRSVGYIDESSVEFKNKLMNKPTSDQSAEISEELRGLGYLMGNIEQPEVPTEQGIRHDKEKTDLNEKLDIALRQQKEGNCEASIRTNKEILSVSPPPPDSVKEKAYLSLAQCYEQKGEWDIAIANYKNLQEVAPEQTAFAKEKIEYLEQQNTQLKSRRLKSLGYTQ